MPATDNPSPLAYSYVRFSTPEQAKGDSLRRQTEAAQAWCERHKVRLDESTTLHDLGKSAYTGGHRKNPDRNALAGFLKLVEAGRVPRGSYLIIENLDRLSREHIQPALLLALGLLQAGVRIVQLKPAEIIFDDKSDTLPVMMMMMELSRGHGESAVKSERVREAWAQKRERARRGEQQRPSKWTPGSRGFLTSKLPAWVEEKDGSLVLVPERAAIVKRIFALARGGYGIGGIVGKLTKEGVPALGKSGHWVRSYIGRILADRRALGEYQPRRRLSQTEHPADGEPLKGYFPAVVSEEEFLAARAGAAQRRFRTGRVASEWPNTLSGLLRNARDGESYYVGLRVEKGGHRHHVLINHTAAERRSACYSFPFDVFEEAVLSLLREIDPREIIDGDSGPDETQTLAGELAGVEAKIAELEAELLDGDVPVLTRVLRSLEARKKDLAGRVAEARQKAAHPLADSWDETHALLDALDGAADPADARIRLRAALRRIVDSIWLLIAPQGRNRLCAVQIRFKDTDKHRDYLILHRPPKANKAARVEGGWSTRGLAEVTDAGSLDLRDREHVARLEEFLTNQDWTAATDVI